MPGLDDLVGETYGPVEVGLDAGRMGEFVESTGDDPQRWASIVPPLFAARPLFAVAPLFFGDERVVPYTRSYLHTEQKFVWKRPAAVGEVMEVNGRVAAARSRGRLNIVVFEFDARSDQGAWLEASAQFVMSDQAAAAEPEGSEPPARERPEVDEPAAGLALPDAGEPITPLRCGASRLDLIRYAAATRDWNPIHWDHASAVAAGLSGTIVHGLLMAAWMGRAAQRHVTADLPISTLSLRFRKPLRPAVAAVVTGSVAERHDDGADLDLTLEAEGERLVTARARVTA